MRFSSYILPILALRATPLLVPFCARRLLRGETRRGSRQELAMIRRAYGRMVNRQASDAGGRAMLERFDP
jgi:hypothetical protein